MLFLLVLNILSAFGLVFFYSKADLATNEFIEAVYYLCLTVAFGCYLNVNAFVYRYYLSYHHLDES